jgi:hypothetical protein
MRDAVRDFADELANFVFTTTRNRERRIKVREGDRDAIVTALSFYLMFRDNAKARAFLAKTAEDEPRPGDDLSYYLGPSATNATQDQCDELARNVAEAGSANG